MDPPDHSHKWRKGFRPSRRKQIKPKLNLRSDSLPAEDIAILEKYRPHLSIHRHTMVHLMLDDFILHFNFQQTKVAQQALGGRSDPAKRARRCLSEFRHVRDEAGVTLGSTQKGKHFFERPRDNQS